MRSVIFQLEKIISQREQNQEQKERIHEAQLCALREQLDRERQKQRQTSASLGGVCTLRTVTAITKRSSTRKTLRKGDGSDEQPSLQLAVYGSQAATSTRPPPLPSSSHSHAYYDHQDTVLTSLSTVTVEEQPADNASNDIVVEAAGCIDQADSVNKGITNKPVSSRSSVNKSTRL